MAQILIRHVDDVVVERLKARAKRRGRSLQAEVKTILEQTTKMDMATAKKVALRIRRSLKGRRFEDSAVLIRESRNR